MACPGQASRFSSRLDPHLPAGLRSLDTSQMLELGQFPPLCQCHLPVTVCRPNAQPRRGRPSAQVPSSLSPGPPHHSPWKCLVCDTQRSTSGEVGCLRPKATSPTLGSCLTKEIKTLKVMWGVRPVFAPLSFCAIPLWWGITNLGAGVLSQWQVGGSGSIEGRDVGIYIPLGQPLSISGPQGLPPGSGQQPGRGPRQVGGGEERGGLYRAGKGRRDQDV